MIRRGHQAEARAAAATTMAVLRGAEPLVSGKLDSLKAHLRTLDTDGTRAD